MNKAMRARIKQLDAEVLEDPISITPCGPLDKFYTKCNHTRCCAVSVHCSIAIRGPGDSPIEINQTSGEKP